MRSQREERKEEREETEGEREERKESEQGREAAPEEAADHVVARAKEEEADQPPEESQTLELQRDSLLPPKGDPRGPLSSGEWGTLDS